MGFAQSPHSACASGHYRDPKMVVSKSQGQLVFKVVVMFGNIAKRYLQKTGQVRASVCRRCAGEEVWAFKASIDKSQGRVPFEYSRQWVYVNHCYFYLIGEDFSPAFICGMPHRGLRQQLLKPILTKVPLVNYKRGSRSYWQCRLGLADRTWNMDGLLSFSVRPNIFGEH